MRVDHRVQLRGLLGRISADAHANLVILAESVAQAAKRGDPIEQRRLVEEYERALRAATGENGPSERDEETAHSA